jgi:hypothetical protein
MGPRAGLEAVEKRKIPILRRKSKSDPRQSSQISAWLKEQRRRKANASVKTAKAQNRAQWRVLVLALPNDSVSQRITEI